MTSSLNSIHPDLYVALFQWLDVKSNYHLSRVCKYLNQLSEDAFCTLLWKEAANKLGIKALLKGKTWKQTACIIRNRWDNPKYSLCYHNVTPPLENYINKIYLYEVGHCAFSGNTVFEKGVIGIEISQQGKLTCKDSEGSKELLTIDWPGGYKVHNPRDGYRPYHAALHECLLAITFVQNQTFQFEIGDETIPLYGTSHSTVLQVWNLDTKQKIVQKTFNFAATFPKFNATQIVIALSRDHNSGAVPPSNYAIFELCLSEKKQDSSANFFYI